MSRDVNLKCKKQAKALHSAVSAEDNNPKNSKIGSEKNLCMKQLGSTR